jgi:hypothetical protein
MFVRAVRRLVANLTVEDCLQKRKESLAAFLVGDIAPVVSGAGRTATPPTWIWASSCEKTRLTWTEFLTVRVTRMSFRRSF